MKNFIALAAVAALTATVAFAPKPALADNGRIAAGVVGGLAVGAIVGSQINRNDDGYRVPHPRLCPRVLHRTPRLRRSLRPPARPQGARL